MDLVYEHYDRYIYIADGVVLHCHTSKDYEYMIDCELNGQLLKVVYNIDNGYNTKQSIFESIRELVRELKGFYSKPTQLCLF